MMKVDGILEHSRDDETWHSGDELVTRDGIRVLKTESILSPLVLRLD